MSDSVLSQKASRSGLQDLDFRSKTLTVPPLQLVSPCPPDVHHPDSRMSPPSHTASQISYQAPGINQLMMGSVPTGMHGLTAIGVPYGCTLCLQYPTQVLKVSTGTGPAQYWASLSAGVDNTGIDEPMIYRR